MDQPQRAHLTVGATIKHLRTTRTDLSARAFSLAAGLSESYVGKIEAGRTEPSVRAFALIAAQLRMSPGEIYVLLQQEATR